MSRIAILPLLFIALAFSSSFGADGPAGRSDEPRAGLRVKLLVVNGCQGTSKPAPVIAGDTVSTQIRVDGITRDSDGKLDMSFRLDLLDGTGNSIKSIPWQRINFPPGLGGDTFIFSAELPLPADLSTGLRSLRISIKDELGGNTAADELAIPVLDRETFAATNCLLTMDSFGQQKTPGVFFAGINGFLHFQFCGFTKTKDDMHVEATLTILDQDARPLDISPIRISGKTEGLERVQNGRLPATFHFGLSRPGRFILRLTAEDVPTGRTSARDIPIHVMELTDPNPDDTAIKSTPPKR